uniref:F-box domain-containing protein n=1 Tax=Kalanchoe fedtschenkoi TaxID=63787 RepID=A0A7N0UF32_KALFE
MNSSPSDLQKRPRLENHQQLPAGSYIPDDILFDEILVRLPVRSLLRFRAVCEIWQEKIESKDFIQLHLKHHSLKKDSHLLLTHSNNNGYYRQAMSVMRIEESGAASIEAVYSSPPHSCSLQTHKLDKFEMVAFCRGLVCAVASSRNSRLPQVIFVWNPFTGAHREFPYHVLKSGMELGVPSMSFAYDPINDDYKIFVIGTSMDSDSPLHIEVFSLKNKSWRTLDATEDAERPAGTRVGITRTNLVASDDGDLYMGLTHYLAPPGSKMFTIFKFNLSEERFSRYEAPPIPPVLYKGNYKLGLYKGSLCLYHMFGKSGESYGRNVDIWVSNSDESWSKVMHISEEMSRENVPGHKWSRQRDQAFDVGVVNSRFGVLHRSLQRNKLSKKTMWRRSLSVHDPEDNNECRQILFDPLHEAYGADILPTESLISP